MKRLFLIILSFFVAACMSARKPSAPTYNERMLSKETMKADLKPNFVEGTPSADPVQSSLWARSVGSPYIIRNQKAQKVGDLLTILIEEETSASTQAKTDAKRDGSVDLSGSLGFGQGTSSTAGQLSAKAGNVNDFKGEGKTNRSGQFTSKVQAVVENVLPNGTLFVRGRKVITINHEDQEIEISGFVRPDDIRINNTVVSTVMADAQIRYVGEGVISDKQHTGWGTRLLDAIWPF